MIQKKSFLCFRPKIIMLMVLMFMVIALNILGVRLLISTSDATAVRIKDIVSVEGIRDNQLIGYGIVVGVKGTGDDLTSSPYSKETIIAMLERLGVNVRDQQANQRYR